MSLLFARDGVLPACICKDAKEFKQNIKGTANAAEREIKELKKGAGGKLLRSSAPKHLWDNCLELEAFIRSNRGEGTQNSDVRQNIRH